MPPYCYIKKTYHFLSIQSLRYRYPNHESPFTQQTSVSDSAASCWSVITLDRWFNSWSNLHQLHIADSKAQINQDIQQHPVECSCIFHDVQDEAQNHSYLSRIGFYWPVNNITNACHRLVLLSVSSYFTSLHVERSKCSEPGCFHHHRVLRPDAVSTSLSSRWLDPVYVLHLVSKQPGFLELQIKLGQVQVTCWQFTIK